MVDNAAERRAIIEWFKNDFTREAGSTTETAKLPDGMLSYNFSVTNTSGMNFSKFKFDVKVVDRLTDKPIGVATINAGGWAVGVKKNFKSRFFIPANISNISFVMFAESIEYEGSRVGGNTQNAGTGGAAQNTGSDSNAQNAGASVTMQNAGTGSSVQNIGSGNLVKNTGGSMLVKSPNTNTYVAGVQRQGSANTNTFRGTTSSAPMQPAQSFVQKKTEKKLNKMRMGKSGWITATLVMGCLFALGAIISLADRDYPGFTESAMLAAPFLGIFGYLKYSIGSKAKRIRTYETRINKRGNTSLDDLAASVGRPFEKAADELHQMIVDGFFPGAYVDIENRLLVMTQNGQPIEDVAKSVAMNKKAKRKAARKDGVVPESIDDLITMTDDSEIKTKLKSLRTITKKIDARVEQVPELEKQVSDFRDNFYPEVVRLTDEYNEKIVDMGRYGEEKAKREVTESAEGAPLINTNPNYLQEQAEDIKSQLISLIDSVTEASENLLERLHEDDIMDITTDIKMLQTTLAGKGLLDSDFDVK
ncbi:MAG: hypothetical protein IKE52_06990 [Mogibacterium sp.]|nr:hypothetical protein [Mogibacterium sp.]